MDTHFIDEDCDPSDENSKRVIVGICAMERKSHSQPMKEILTRLEDFEYIKCRIFSESVILKEPVENWPYCDCLISFHSKGFPLDKALSYAQLRKPFVINDLEMQYILQDRRKVYQILAEQGIMLPRFEILDRDAVDFVEERDFIEGDDMVEINGHTFNKPFVEKPVSAEDHNIYIYYPTSAGGGSQRLFRKIGSRSSVYSPESHLRRSGSYIYENFMPTDGTDVKVYTVGPEYAHAEARKSPALDGKVERDEDGKEIRYPVILTSTEKFISRKVCRAFRQMVCGFDLLRANGKSYVCDVNGFSFVKNSNKYYDDSSKILGNMILRQLAPSLHIPWSMPFQLDDPPIVPTTIGKMMELRCVIGVIRHGDRTPKQKLKMRTRHNRFFEIFHKYKTSLHTDEVKLKKPKQLQEILDVARELLNTSGHKEVEKIRTKLEQLRNVLQMYGHFSGINRKIQIKYFPHGWTFSSDDENQQDSFLLLIMKWGGELTPAGKVQAEEMGRLFRCMYPGGQGEYSAVKGLGLLRLHSTYRHDLKIYASDEGRVQMTAAAFAKGLLALEGEITPILVQMVKSADTNGLLDNDTESKKLLNCVKEKIHRVLQCDRDFTEDDLSILNPTSSISVELALNTIKNPVKTCELLYGFIQDLLFVINERMRGEHKDIILYHGETWSIMRGRWNKLERDFKLGASSSGVNRFDISKIPDIYDNIKYDLHHNQNVLHFLQAEEMYCVAKILADFIVPQEYGLTRYEKLAISLGICTPLLKKIRTDLLRNVDEPSEDNVNRLNPRYSKGVSSPQRHVRSRLYFTSESHIHSLLTMLRFGGLTDPNDEQWTRAMEYVSAVTELNYMSQIVIMLYEDPNKDLMSENRFHVELHFSPGVNCCVYKNSPQVLGFRTKSRNQITNKSNVSSSNNQYLCTCCPLVIMEETEEEEEVHKNEKIYETRRSSAPIYSTSISVTTPASMSTGLPDPQSFMENKCGSPDKQTQTTILNKSSKTRTSNEEFSHVINQKTTTIATTSSRQMNNFSVHRCLHMLSDKQKASGTWQHTPSHVQKSTSSGGLFSTAIISGSASAPELKSFYTPMTDVSEGAEQTSSIRSLETLHNALSLRQINSFIDRVTDSNTIKQLYEKINACESQFTEHFSSG